MSFNNGEVKRELVIIGAGGFGAIAACVADDINAALKQSDDQAKWNLIGYADGDPAKRGTNHAGRTVHGTIEEVGLNLRGHEVWFFCAIGNNGARATMAKVAEELGWKPATLVHPSAIVARSAEIAAGTYVGPGTVISSNARIGAHVILDMQVSVGHDAVISDFCSVFPGARITGCCRLEEYVLVGANAALLPGTVVGDRAVVGACSLAHGHVPADTTILGVPARIIQKRSYSKSHTMAV